MEEGHYLYQCERCKRIRVERIWDNKYPYIPECCGDCMDVIMKVDEKNIL